KTLVGAALLRPKRPSVNLIGPLILINVDILGVDHISLLFVRTRSAAGLAALRPATCWTRAGTGRTCSGRASLLARLIKRFGDLVQRPFDVFCRRPQPRRPAFVHRLLGVVDRFFR